LAARLRIGLAAQPLVELELVRREDFLRGPTRGPAEERAERSLLPRGQPGRELVEALSDPAHQFTFTGRARLRYLPSSSIIRPLSQNLRRAPSTSSGAASSSDATRAGVPMSPHSS